MISPSKAFAARIPSSDLISVGAYADSRENPHKEFDNVGGRNHVENRTEVLESSMREVEDTVCTMC